MNKTVVGLLTGLMLAIIGTVVLAGSETEKAKSRVSGAVATGDRVEEVILWKTDKNRAFETEYFRDTLYIPIAYGALKSVVPGPKSSQILWFEANDGTLRNVFLKTPAELVYIERVQQ